MVAFSSIFAIGALIASTFATPIHSSELNRRALPVGISTATAKTYLTKLTVTTPYNSPPYRRDFFHTWIIINGKCDTRETVLMRDGTNVVTNSACSPVSGRWVSPYDDVPTTLASDLDIDHVVPLKEAWISGARDWTADLREQFANDLVRPQLVAVTDNLNQAKGENDPATWLPPLNSFKCTYVVAYIQVKYYYNLTIDSAEKTALTTTLNNFC